MGVDADLADPNFIYFGKSIARIRRTSQASSSTSNRCIGAPPGGTNPIAEMTDDGTCVVSTAANCFNHTPIRLDQVNPNILYVGCRSLWQTTGAKIPDANLSTLQWNKLVTSDPSHKITTLTLADYDHNIVWFGTTRFNALDQSDIWSNFSGAFAKVNDVGLPARPITDIALHPTDTMRVYVSFSGYSGQNIWRSNNRGTNWTDISAGLPQTPIWSLAVHPTQDKWIYAGTEVGLYTSHDDGVTWSKTIRGTAIVPISDLYWAQNKTTLVMGTYGRSVQQMDFAVDPEVINPETMGFSQGVFGSGHLENLIISDNRKLVAASNTASTTRNISIVFTGRTGIFPVPANSNLSFSIEHADISTLQLRVELFNFSTSTFQAFTFPPAGSDTVSTVNITGKANQFVNSARTLIARITWLPVTSGAIVDAMNWKIDKP